MSRVILLATMAAAAVMVAGSVGCSTASVTYVDAGASYNEAEALALSGELDAGELAQAPTSETAERRHDALVDLRRQGSTAAEAATLITKTFPADASGVPFYVERATFESVPALVIVESIGRSEGSLSDVRVWVIDLDGAVLLSGTR